MKKALFLSILYLSPIFLWACSIFYYQDPKTGYIYIVNNEDYWYDVHPYVQEEPRTPKTYARRWWGWNKFAQGGINEYGLFFDGATTPKQRIPVGYTDPKGRNVGDELLAYCKNVQEALAYLEKEKIAISAGHLFLGDSTGYAVVAEWVNGKRILHEIQNHQLIATNTLLCDAAGLKQCYRYQNIELGLQKLDSLSTDLDLKTVGQVMARAVQPPAKDSTGRAGGTLYTNFICWQTGELIFIYKLDNSKKFQWNLKEWNYTKRRKYELS